MRGFERDSDFRGDRSRMLDFLRGQRASSLYFLLFDRAGAMAWFGVLAPVPRRGILEERRFGDGFDEFNGQKIGGRRHGGAPAQSRSAGQNDPMDQARDHETCYILMKF